MTVAPTFDALDRPLDHLAQRGEDVPPIAAPRSNTTPDDYRAMVLKAKDYIAAGDMMQVQIGQRLRKRYTESPLSLYRALRSLNPSP